LGLRGPLWRAVSRQREPAPRPPSLRSLLSDRLPQLSAEELDFRLDMAVVALFMLNRGRLRGAPFDEGRSDTSDDAFARWALAFIAGGITAAPSPRP
jgi:hypothetical protein